MLFFGYCIATQLLGQFYSKKCSNAFVCTCDLGNICDQFMIIWKFSKMSRILHTLIMISFEMFTVDFSQIDKKFHCVCSDQLY